MPKYRTSYDTLALDSTLDSNLWSTISLYVVFVFCLVRAIQNYFSLVDPEWAYTNGVALKAKPQQLCFLYGGDCLDRRRHVCARDRQVYFATFTARRDQLWIQSSVRTFPVRSEQIQHRNPNAGFPQGTCYPQ